MKRVDTMVFTHENLTKEVYHLVVAHGQNTYEQVITLPNSEVFTDLLTEEQFLYNIQLYLDNTAVKLVTVA